MMTIETRVNGVLINYISLLRKDRVLEEEGLSGFALYNVEYYRMGKDSRQIKFSLLHSPRDGAEKLAFLVYKELNKRLKNK